MGHIVYTVLAIYFKLAMVYYAYFGAKFYTQHFDFKKFTITQKVVHYAKCLGVVCGVALVCSYNWAEADDSDHTQYIESENPTRGWIVLLMLVGPVIFGIEDGKHGERIRGNYSDDSDSDV